MVIPPEILHDLKSERSDVLPPLPITMRLIPVIFYASAVGVIFLMALTFLQYRVSLVALERSNQEISRVQKSNEELLKAQDALEIRARYAVDLLKWVEGSVGLQPLVVAINRSMGPQSAITDLSLGRSDKTDGQLQISLKLRIANADQLEKTVEAIRLSGFRPFSARQSQEGNRMAYEATLIRNTGEVATEAGGKSNE